MTTDELNDFAGRYAKAWCSHNPESVAAFFAENASLTVNGGPPTPVLEVARGFMRDFPNMTVTFDKLESRGDRTAFHWTLTGTFSGTGHHVQISGYELWKINSVGLIAESSGHFDAAEYAHQLKEVTRVTSECNGAPRSACRIDVASSCCWQKRNENETK